MTFDFEVNEYETLYGGSTEVQQSAVHLESTATELATQTAQFSEALVHALDEESGGAYSDYTAALEQTVVAINESAQSVQAVHSADQAQPYVEHIQQSSAYADDTVTQIEGVFGQQSDQVQHDNQYVAQQSSYLHTLLSSVSEAASNLFGWWQHATQQRQPVDLHDPQQVQAQDHEQVASRGHWRDMAHAAPQNSVGSLIDPIADPLYAVVGETAGEGIGSTFEANASLFNQVNDTPEDMARAIIAWAEYETGAIQTNPDTSLAARGVGAMLSERNRASILWASYQSLHPDLDLADSPYTQVGAQPSVRQQVFEQNQPLLGPNS